MDKDFYSKKEDIMQNIVCILVFCYFLLWLLCRCWLANKIKSSVTRKNQHWKTNVREMATVVAADVAFFCIVPIDSRSIIWNCQLAIVSATFRSTISMKMLDPNLISLLRFISKLMSLRFSKSDLLWRIRQKLFTYNYLALVFIIHQWMYQTINFFIQLYLKSWPLNS
jgi:hypothetical protein